MGRRRYRDELEVTEGEQDAWSSRDWFPMLRMCVTLANIFLIIYGVIALAILIGGI